MCTLQFPLLKSNSTAIILTTTVFMPYILTAGNMPHAIGNMLPATLLPAITDTQQRKKRGRNKKKNKTKHTYLRDVNSLTPTIDVCVGI